MGSEMCIRDRICLEGMLTTSDKVICVLCTQIYVNEEEREVREHIESYRQSNADYGREVTGQELRAMRERLNLPSETRARYDSVENIRRQRDASGGTEGGLDGTWEGFSQFLAARNSSNFTLAKSRCTGRGMA